MKIINKLKRENLKNYFCNDFELLDLERNEMEQINEYIKLFHPNLKLINTYYIEPTHKNNSIKVSFN